jgi:hypothetical protein
MWNEFQGAAISASGEMLSDLRFDFGALASVWMGLLLVALAMVLTFWIYWPRLARLSRGIRFFVVALRCLVVALTLFMLLDPCMVGYRIRPGDNFVVMLFDDSKSLQVSDETGATRGAKMVETYATSGAELERQLRQKFQLVHYRFGDGAERIGSTGELTFRQSETDITGGIEDVLREMQGLSVSGIVLLSDGAQQPVPLDGPNKRFSTPIFTVGTDNDERWSRDLALDSISVQRTNADDGHVVLTGHVSAEGLEGEDAVFEVLEGERTVSSVPITIGGDSWKYETRLEFVPKGNRWVNYKARVRLSRDAPQAEEAPSEAVEVSRFDRVKPNNSRDFSVDNRKKTFRVLYFCGGPTWENKFFRRAMEEDEQIQLTSLVRVSRAEKTWAFRGTKSSLTNPLFTGSDEETFDQPRYDEAVVLRLGAGESELITGYPEKDEDLFPFDLVIWGDIEYEFFSMAQLEATQDFVQKRGGSFLLLGGPRSFAEGGYEGTLIDNMLPVVLGRSTSRTRGFASSMPFSVVPTAEGLIDSVWSLEPLSLKSQEQWQDMTQLHGVNAFPLTRAGASVLSRVQLSDEVTGASKRMDGQAFYAMQQYGRGKCAVLATGETWPWRMNAPAENQRHERLWRQLVRELVTTVPEATVVQDKPDGFPVQEEHRLVTVVRDRKFEEREGLIATASVETPSGRTVALPVEESIREAGVYEAAFFPEETGAHLFNFEAVDDKNEVIGTLEEMLVVEPDQREFQSPQYNAGFLKSIAQNSGGRHFSLSELDRVASHIPWVQENKEDTVRRHLWHFPPLFLLLFAMLGLEWFFRRRKGYA